MAKLTTTSHAILGLLQRRTWSAYELNKYMQRSGIRAVWPRTESRIYVEFKNLVAHGLATSQKEAKQGRKRTIYKITPAGRKALRSWLRTSEGGLRLESEPLLKLLYADLDAMAADSQLSHMRLQISEEANLLHHEIVEALDKGFFFDENALENAHLISLLVDMLEARTQWLTQREGAASSRNSTEQARRIYASQAQRLETLIKGMSI